MYGSRFVKDFLNFGIGFLHIHWLKTLASLEDKIKPATCIPNPLARFGYFFFLNTSHLYSLVGSGFVQDFLNFGIGFLHIHWLKTLASLEDKIKPATYIPNPLARSGYFSFSILHTHFLVTADLLHFLLMIFSKLLPLNWWLNLQIYRFVAFP